MWFMWKIAFARHMKKITGCTFGMAWAEAEAAAESAFSSGEDHDTATAREWAEEAIEYWED